VSKNIRNHKLLYYTKYDYSKANPLFLLVVSNYFIAYICHDLTHKDKLEYRASLRNWTKILKGFYDWSAFAAGLHSYLPPPPLTPLHPLLPSQFILVIYSYKDVYIDHIKTISPFVFINMFIQL